MIAYTIQLTFFFLCKGPLALVGAELFVSLAEVRAGAAPVQSDVDFFVAAFVEMANCAAGDEVTRQAQRIGGLRG